MHGTAPLDEHRWLQHIAGNWTYESAALMGPDKPPVKSIRKELVRTIGEYWILAEAQGQMPDGKPTTMFVTAGYDPELKKYVATWFGSMMPKLRIYDCSRAGNTLNMNADGPSMSGDGSTSLYRDSMEIVDADHRTFRSQVRNPDGSWTQFLTMQYSRTK